MFQVSNRYLDLGAVVRGLAAEAGQETVSITTTGDLYVDTHEASYVIATNNREFLADATVRTHVFRARQVMRAAVQPFAEEIEAR